MAGEFKNVILNKKIGNVVYNVFPQTKAELVKVDASTTLDTKLTSIDSSISAINDESTGILAQAKSYTDTKFAGVAAAFQFKGTVDYVDELPDGTTGHERSIGDVYQVRYRGPSSEQGTDPLNAEYAFDGTNWVELGSIIDLSAYYTSAQVDSAISTAITTYDTNTVQPALATKARFLLSTTQPADLTEADIWAQDVTPAEEPEQGGE